MFPKTYGVLYVPISISARSSANRRTSRTRLRARAEKPRNKIKKNSSNRAERIPFFFSSRDDAIRIGEKEKKKKKKSCTMRLVCGRGRKKRKAVAGKICESCVQWPERCLPMARTTVFMLPISRRMPRITRYFRSFCSRD